MPRPKGAPSRLSSAFARACQWWRPVAVLWRREILDQLRDWRILLPIFGLTFLFPVIANFTARRMVSFTEEYGARVVAESLFPFLMLAVAFFPVSISLVVALESFAGERERGSIEPLLATPLQDAQLYLGKLLAVLTPPLTALYVGVLGYVLVMGLKAGWWPPPRVLVSVLGLSTLQALVMVSGAVVISTQATSVRGANLLASTIILPMAFLLQGEGTLMFWRRYEALGWIALGLMVLAALLVRVGLAHFNREGLLGREFDALNLRWAWHTFLRGLRGETPTSWMAWWGETWRMVGRSLSREGVLTLLLMALGIALGYRVGAQIPLDHPVSEQEIARLEHLLQTGVVFQREGAWPQGLAFAAYLLTHNARALLLAFLGGLFSFGILGLLFLLLTMGVLGLGMNLLPRLGVVTPGWYWGAMILPHGSVELPALLIFGATLLRLGARWAAPSRGMALGEVWLQALGEGVRVIVGVVVPLMIVAALLEAFLTPWVVLQVLP